MFTTVIGRELFGWPRRFVVRPDEQAWLDEACQLAFAYSKEVQGVGLEAQTLDVMVIGRAAEHLWAHATDRPRWCDLDVDAVIERLTAQLPGSDARDLIATILDSFAVWLHANRHIDLEEVIELRSRLCPHVASLYRRLLGACVAQPS